MSEIDWEALRLEARAATERAYVPYSHFPVGVAALTDTGKIVGDERLYTMSTTLYIPGQPPQVQAESAAMVPLTAMHKVRVGAKVPVKYAADNPNLMMFEWDKIKSVDGMV